MSDKIVEERHEYDSEDPRVDPDLPPPGRRWYNSFRVRKVRGPSFLSIILGILIAAAIAAGVYYYYYGNRSLSSDISSLGSSSKDAATTAAVKTAFSLNKQLANDSISVTTTNGEVTLNGEVASEEEKKTAEELAHNTRGVQSVVNNLMITTAGKTEQRVKDLEVQTKVLEALLANEMLKGQDIKAHVSNQVVTLEGRVDTQEQKNVAAVTAQHIPGVREVKDEDLAVRSQQPAQPPTQ